jgi:Putative amidoligase enzyme
MTLTADTRIQNEETFVCTRCGESKPASAYYTYNGRRMNHCKACEIARSAQSHRDGGVQIHSSRTFGAEIEFYAPVDAYLIADKLTAAGINTHYEGYNHTTRSHWKIVTDGSLNDRPAGCSYAWELVSPAKTA